jgi:hypothetical protein
MSVIQPTPSQAAVILKKFLAEKNLDIKLSDAQEALARMSGYASFSVLTSAIPLRGHTTTQRGSSLPSTEDVEVAMLFSIGGRYHGDDDDTVMHVWTTEGELTAIDVFKAEILSYGERDDESLVYITSTDLLGRRINGTFVFEPTFQYTKPKQALCKKCNSALDIDLYCSDETCPYHDWPQHLDDTLLVEQTTAQIEDRFSVHKRTTTLNGLTIATLKEQTEALVAEQANSPQNRALATLTEQLKQAVLETGLLALTPASDGKRSSISESGLELNVTFKTRIGLRLSLEVVFSMKSGQLTASVHTKGGFEDGHQYSIWNNQSDNEFFDEISTTTEDATVLDLVRKVSAVISSQKSGLLQQGHSLYDNP